MKNEAEIPHDCPVTEAFQIMGGKWKPVIVYHLKDRERRFGELRRLIPSASQKMLTQQLRSLERDGLVHREVFKQVPPRVDYSLTELGESIRPIYKQLDLWLSAHEGGIAQARTDFDDE